mgnify:CR=1 FL=1
MSSNINKLTLESGSTGEVADGKLFITYSYDSGFIFDSSRIYVTVGAIGGENIRKEMIIGDVIRYKASFGTYEIRLLSSKGETADFSIAKIE